MSLEKSSIVARHSTVKKIIRFCLQSCAVVHWKQFNRHPNIIEKKYMSSSVYGTTTRDLKKILSTLYFN